jgi:hypothetical protein
VVSRHFDDLEAVLELTPCDWPTYFLLSVDHWHEAIANPTVADAILDRLVHKAHRLTLTGDSMRKAAAKRSGPESLSPSDSELLRPHLTL